MENKVFRYDLMIFDRFEMRGSTQEAIVWSLRLHYIYVMKYMIDHGMQTEYALWLVPKNPLLLSVHFKIKFNFELFSRFN